jgi:hypothetical protein
MKNWHILIASVVFLSLTACQSGKRLAVPDPDDLLFQARTWRTEHGMAKARDDLTEALGKLDSGKGEFERRLWRTNADKSLTFPDSLSGLSLAKRHRTGIFLVLGYKTKTGTSERVIRQVESYLKKQGWHAVLVEVKERGTTSEDAAAIQAVMQREMPKVDKAILVGFSKGGLDWMHWFADEAADLPSAQRSKIRLLVTFAGALRGAVVADWVAVGGGPLAGTLRLVARSKSDSESLADIRSIGEDPWTGPKKPRIRSLTNGLRHVSLVALPEGENGLTQVDRAFAVFSRLVTAQWRWLGPLDGFVESAAQVLPDEAGIPQHIVRVRGSHALLDGRYLSGGLVSRKYSQRGSDFWSGGEEVLDDILRALPIHWVWRKP